MKGLNSYHKIPEVLSIGKTGAKFKKPSQSSSDTKDYAKG